MNKKEVVLTVAKDLLIAHSIKPSSALQEGKKIPESAKLLNEMALEVEKIYDSIKE